jgi:lipoprotein-anchoring transpeptidase ErfK/SrfK
MPTPSACKAKPKEKNIYQLNRRHFLTSTAALFAAPLPTLAQEQDVVESKKTPISDRSMWARWDARVTPSNYDPATSNPWGLHSRFLPQRVAANPGLVPGDIHVDAIARYLYHIQSDGTAMRYGVAIARGDLYEPGIYNIKRKARWPIWTPTASMIEREPDVYGPFADGMDGGPTNPLGSRALYLYEGNRDTYLRIHGTPQPRSIGSRASSGCVRMVMAHIIDLHAEVRTGSTAFLYPPENAVTAPSEFDLT